MTVVDISDDRGGKFAGDDPFALARDWLAEAEETEPNDATAMALATVDAGGMPNVRMVLCKQISDKAFVFFTNYTSAKAAELDAAGKAALVMHWKSQRRQIRVRGLISRASEAESDAYFATRSVFSRVGAWASDQSSPLAARSILEARAAELENKLGDDPERPPHWGGYRLVPLEMEFWADGAARLHDRFRWTRKDEGAAWQVTRLNP